MGVRVFGTPHLPTGPETVKFTIVTDMGTLSGSSPTAPLLTQFADGDVWTPTHALEQTIRTMIAWIEDALLAPGGMGFSQSATLTGEISYSESAGETVFVLTLSDLGDDAGATIQSITLDNTSGWATPLGLVEDGSSRTINAVAGVIAITGAFQPRTLHAYPRSELDSGDKKTKPNRFAHPLGDGDIVSFEIGNSIIKREYQLVDLGPSHTGPPHEVARFLSFGANRKVINTQTPSVSNSTNALELIEVGNYLSIGNSDWCSRVKSVVGTVINLWEPFPATVSPNVGDEISIISEADAHEREASRTDHFIYYGQDDENDVPRLGQYGDYCLDGNGEVQQGIEQPRNTEALFSWRFDLVKYRKNKLNFPV